MTVAKPIRILLVDDHVMVRQGVRDLLDSYPNIEVVGEAGDGEEGFQQAAKLQPTVIVMDITMPKMDGVASTRLIKTHYPHMAVVGLSVLTHSYHRDAMVKAGASEVIGKEQAVDELYGAIQKAATSSQPNVIVDDAPVPLKPSQTEGDAERPLSTNPVRIVPRFETGKGKSSK